MPRRSQIRSMGEGATERSVYGALARIVGAACMTPVRPSSDVQRYLARSG